MILTTHILAGAVLGANIQNPCAVAGLAVAVHFALDLLPHGDYLNKKSSFKEFWKVALDLAIGFGAVAAILFFRGETSSANLQNIAIGIFFSLLPDGTTLLYMMGMKFLKPIKMFHEKMHFYPDFSSKREFRFKNNLFDILISLIAVIILISLR
ncbi:MAG: hypothetical protein WC726_00740 [Parcubacteria group bacterium]|jgi:hypothetical protein